MTLSALYLSLQRLREKIDSRVFDAAGSALATALMPNDQFQRAIFVDNVAKATLNWVERESLPTLDDLIKTKKLAYGCFFTHEGPFYGKGIVASEALFAEGKPPKVIPTLHAKLPTIGPKVILKVQVHPRNYTGNSTVGELSEYHRLFMIGRLTVEKPPVLEAQAYAIGHIYDQPTLYDDTLAQKPIASTQLAKKQKTVYSKFEYQCSDQVFIPGTLPISRRHLILVNDKEAKIGDSLFRLFLRFVVELKKNEGGWVYTSTLEKEGVTTDEQIYKKVNPLRSKLEGYLLENDAHMFIENKGAKRYRISAHPDFITYDKERLCESTDFQIRELAKKLP